MKPDSVTREVKIASWSFALPTRTKFKVLNDSTRAIQQRIGSRPFIPRGAGRSYGDAAYLTDGLTLSSANMQKIFAFDPDLGTVGCETGVTIGQLHEYLEQTGWSFPIYGGTQWATIGGGIGTDIHGKNAVSQGSFGNHVESLMLMVPDGQLLECSPTVRPDLFAATIGGMGLTGLVKSVKLKLQRYRPQTVHMKTRLTAGIDHALACFDSTDDDFQFFSCAGCMSKPSHKGLFVGASYGEGEGEALRTPIEIPLPTLNVRQPHLRKLGLWIVRSIGLKLYGKADKLTHIRNYNYIGAHETIKHINKLWGSMIEYQFAVSAEQIRTACTELFNLYMARSIPCNGYMMKKFGDIRPVGLLSFPTSGYTVNFLTDDTPEARKMLVHFTDILLELGGRVYLAKDSCILARQFERMYDRLPEWREIVRQYDPKNRVQSDLSRRLNMKPW